MARRSVLNYVLFIQRKFIVLFALQPSVAFQIGAETQLNAVLGMLCAAHLTVDVHVLVLRLRRFRLLTAHGLVITLTVLYRCSSVLEDG